MKGANNIIILIICILNVIPSKGQDTSFENSVKDSLDIINDSLIKPMLSFGVMADVQYADKDPRTVRYYRTSIDRLKKCVKDLNSKELEFTIQLGDLIDGHNQNLEKTHEDLKTVTKVIEQLEMPVFHVIGNHDLRVDKEYLQKVLGLDRNYYDFTIQGLIGWRFVVLDGNDNGYGVMTNSQINWLNFTLKKARLNKERVICFSHYALIKEAAENHRMYESESVLEILDNSNCVVAWFAGHDHSGGYALHNGIHHVTFKAMVEAPKRNSYGVVELYSDRIRIIGVGKEEDRELLLN